MLAVLQRLRGECRGVSQIPRICWIREIEDFPRLDPEALHSVGLIFVTPVEVLKRRIVCPVSKPERFGTERCNILRYLFSKLSIIASDMPSTVRPPVFNSFMTNREEVSLTASMATISSMS